MKRFKYKELSALDTERKRKAYGLELLEYYKLKKGYPCYYVCKMSAYLKVLEVTFTDWRGRTLEKLFFSDYVNLIETMPTIIKRKK